MIHRLHHLPLLLATTVTVTALGRPAAADNIDVSTIPGRDSVQLTIYNSEDLTLVRETRHVTFRKGLNPIQFSWANTLIDPTSVELRFKTHADDLDILDATFPHDRPQMLYWNVRSALDGDAEVEITYFTSGITWAADYVCIADNGEDRMSFEGFVRITNNSGEDYADAQVRLVVGEINLVEKVAELARRGIISEEEKAAYFARSRKVRDFADDAREELSVAAGARMSAAPQAPKEIIKEGLSEYFIYTIEGTETVRNTWSKRMRLFDGAKIPFDIRYRYRPREYGDQLARLFILRNDTASGLGSTPLPDGIVRLFRDNGRNGLSYLTAYQTKYVPIGQEIELNLGADRNVVHERVRLRSWRDSFWFRDTKGKRYFSPDQGHVVQQNFPVAGWHDNEQWIERFRNDRDQPIEIEVRRSFDGHVTVDTDDDATKHDYRTVQFTTTVGANGAGALDYEITYRQGISRKQEKVELR
ncbi:MAG: hypothetical protein GY715_10220 [Planctomycetes bacterium]|nr:hypothetical protein [Planctomycetota bacterium]